MKSLSQWMLLFGTTIILLSKANQYIVSANHEMLAQHMHSGQSSTDSLTQLVQEAHGTVSQFNEKHGFVVAELSDADAAALAADPRGAAQVELDQRRYMDGTFGDYLAFQTVPWGLKRVRADRLTNRGGIKVCVIDSGYFLGHPDLPNSTVSGTNSFGGDPWYYDGCTHGTHVAGTIAAIDNNIGVSSVNGQIDLHIVRVFGNNCGYVWSSTLITAIDACVAAGSHVINLSLGGGGPSTAEGNAFMAAYNNGTLSVASAGNTRGTGAHYPASYPAVVSVAAVDSSDNLASFSTRNAGVELSGPGVDVLSTTQSFGVRINGGVMYPAGNILGTAHYSRSGRLWPYASAGPGDICLVQGTTSTAPLSTCASRGGVAAIYYYANRGDFSFGVPTTSILGVTVCNTTGLLLQSSIGSTVTITQDQPHYFNLSGTSMSSPHVAGVAALVWSNARNCTAGQIRNLLRITADDLGVPGRDTSFGFGMVRADRALSYYQSFGCPPEVSFSTPTTSTFSPGSSTTTTSGPPGTLPPNNGNQVLVLDRTLTDNRNMLNAIAAAGFTAVRASDSTWRSLTTAQFASYRALILADPRCKAGTSWIQAAIDTAFTWGPAINGRMVLLGVDDDYHGRHLVPLNALSWIKAGGASTTGLFFSMSCYFFGLTSNFQMLRPFGRFDILGTSENNLVVVAPGTALGNLSSAYMSNWGGGSHNRFESFPSGSFFVVARGQSSGKAIILARIPGVNYTTTTASPVITTRRPTGFPIARTQTPIGQTTVPGTLGDAILDVRTTNSVTTLNGSPLLNNASPFRTRITVVGGVCIQPALKLELYSLDHDFSSIEWIRWSVVDSGVTQTVTTCGTAQCPVPRYFQTCASNYLLPAGSILNGETIEIIGTPTGSAIGYCFILVNGIRYYSWGRITLSCGGTSATSTTSPPGGGSGTCPATLPRPMFGYTFETITSPTTAFDCFSPLRYPLISVPSVVPIMNPVLQAAVFTGNAHARAVGTQNVLRVNTSYTLFVRVQILNSDSNWRPLWGTGPTVSDHLFLWLLHAAAFTRIGFECTRCGPGGVYHWCSVTLPPVGNVNTIVEIGGVYDRLTQNASLYMNGVQRISCNWAGHSVLGSIGSEWTIAGAPWRTSLRFVGNVYDAYFFHQALTSAQMAQLSGCAFSCSNTTTPISTTTCPRRAVSYPILSANTLPFANMSVSVNPATLTMSVDVFVEFVLPTTTYVIDFTGYWGDIFYPTNCENRHVSTFFGTPWSSIWNPTDPNAVGSPANLLYPPTAGTSWTISQPACNLIKYHGEFTWRDLVRCTNKTGGRSIRVIDSNTAITLSGNVELSIVSAQDKSRYIPLTPNQRQFNYYNWEILKKQFEISVKKTSYTSTTVNTQIVFGEILQAKLDIQTNQVKILFLTLVGSFARLTSGILLSAPVYPTTALSITPRFGNGLDGCVGRNSLSLCLQGWEMTFNRLACPRSYTGPYSIKFSVDCRSLTAADAFLTCQSYKQRFGVNPTVEVAFPVVLLDGNCGVLQSEVRIPIAVQQVNSGSGNATKVYQDGEAIPLRLTPDTSSLNLTGLLANSNLRIYGYDLLAVWVCTAPDLSQLSPIASNNMGGCFPPSQIDGVVPDRVRSSTKVNAPGWNITVVSTFPALDVVVVPPPMPKNRSNFMLHMQVGIDIRATSIRRRMQAQDPNSPPGTNGGSGGTSVSSYGYVTARVSVTPVSDGGGSTTKSPVANGGAGQGPTKDDKMSDATVGMVVGLVIGVLLLFGAGFWYWKKRMGYVFEKQTVGGMQLTDMQSSSFGEETQ